MSAAECRWDLTRVARAYANMAEARADGWRTCADNRNATHTIRLQDVPAGQNCCNVTQWVQQVPRRACGCMLYGADLEETLRATGVPFRRIGSRCHLCFAPETNLRTWTQEEEALLMEAARGPGGGQVTRRGVEAVGGGFAEKIYEEGRGFRVHSACMDAPLPAGSADNGASPSF